MNVICLQTIPAILLIPAVAPLKVAAGVAIFLFVLTFIMAVFGQRGRAEITPEREVALAAGASDRRTVFEMPLLQPVMWLLLAAARGLGMPQTKRKLRRLLVAAGSPNFYTPDEFVAVAMLWGLLAAALLEACNVMVYKGLGVTALVVGFLVGFAAAMYHLHGQAARRVRAISRRLPYTLELIALAMGAGATFIEAVRTVVGEDPDHPFNVELNTVLAEIDLGTTRRQALKNMAERIPLEPLRSIVAAIIQAESLGTPLSNVLKEQASLLRLQRSVRAEKLAAAASVRILVPSLLILMSVVLSVFAPIIIRGIKDELF